MPNSRIEDHLDEDLSVQDVAQFSGYSSHHFQNMFAAVVGMSLGHIFVVGV
jgi:AraC-like DNA-binding protein